MGKVVKAIGKAVGSVFKAVGNFVGMLFKAPKVPKAASNTATETRLNATLVPEEYKKIVFGETAIGADMRFWETYGSTNSNHVQVIAGAGHELTSYGNLYLDEVPVPFDGSGYATTAYAGQLMRRTVTKGVTAAGVSLGSGTRWTPSASMTGCSYYVLDWIYDQAKMPNGIPSRVTQIAKGAKVYDPRRDVIYGGTHVSTNPATWEYSPLDPNGQPIGRNNALQVLAYILGIKVQNPQTGLWVLVGGRGVDIADIEFETFITAANNCEIQGWYSDVLLSTGDDHSQNEAILEAAAGGEVIDVGGRFSYFVSIDDTADVTLYLTESDIVGDIDWEPRLSISQQFNEVPGSFVDPAALFQIRPLPLCYDQAYYDADGYKKRGEELKLSAVQDPVQGQKLQRLRLNRSRFQGVFSAPFNLKALRVRPWSLIRLSFEPFAWTNKLFRVRQQGIGTKGGIQLILEEEDASIYTPGTVVALPAPSAGYGGDPGYMPVVGSITSLASGVSSGATARDTIELTWPLASQFVKHTEIRYKKTGDTYWETAGPLLRDQNYIVLPPLLPTTNYTYQVRHVSLWNVPGNWLEGNRTTNAVTKNSAGQIVYADGTPVENLKPAEAGANVTGSHIAAGFTGQKALATQDVANWASQVTGAAKPEDYATASFVYRSLAAPSSPRANDVWIVLNGSGVAVAVRAWNGSSWITGADLTSVNTAAGFIGQDWGATASENNAANYRLPLGQNSIINSDYSRGTYAHAIWGGNTGLVRNFGVNLNSTYSGRQNVAFVTLVGTPAAGTYTDGLLSTPGLDLASLKQYGLPCTSGERLFASALLANHGNANTCILLLLFDGAANFLAAEVAYGGTPSGAGNGGDPDQMTRVGVFHNVTTAKYAIMVCRMNHAGGLANPYMFTAQEMLCKVAPGQSAFPPYTPGRADPNSDKTLDYTSAGFVGQAWAATNGTEAGTSNAYVPIGVNAIVNSDFSRTTFGHWSPGGNSGLGFFKGVNLNGDYSGVQNVAWGQISGTPPAGTYTDSFRSSPSDSLSDIARFGLPCRLGDRVYFSALVANHRNANTCVILFQWDKNGNFVGGVQAYGGRVNGANGGGDPANMDRVGTFADIISPEIRYATIGVRMNHQGGLSDPYVFHAQEMLCRVAPGQTVVPAYSPGRADPYADQTIVSTAAAISGQSEFATVNRPASAISKLKNNGRSTTSYQVSNGVLTGATLYRSPVYVLGSADVSGAARITIAASTLRGSGIVVSYSAGTIDGAAYATTYYVWIYDPDITGGTVTYVATTDPNIYIDNADYLFVGNIRTTAAAGTTLPPYVPPPTPPGYYDCVAVEAWLPTMQQAFEIKAGDRLLMLNEAGDASEVGECVSNKIALAHCMRFETVSGITLTCSTTTPILYKKEIGYGAKPAWECDGSEVVPVIDANGFRWEALACQPGHIGLKQVAHISANDGVYAAGDTKYAFIFTHNIRADYVKP